MKGYLAKQTFSETQTRFIVWKMLWQIWTLQVFTVLCPSVSLWKHLFEVSYDRNVVIVGQDVPL